MLLNVIIVVDKLIGYINQRRVDMVSGGGGDDGDMNNKMMTSRNIYELLVS